MSDSRPWYSLTDEEVERLNPPDDVYDDAALYDAWLPLGVIPRPKTRLGWFVYHLVHGLWMRYPLHKVLGYALANTQPEAVDDDGDASALHLALEIECSRAEFIAYHQALENGASDSEAYLASLSAGVLDGCDWTGVDLRGLNTSGE